jgi:hypothetical protein
MKQEKAVWRETIDRYLKSLFSSGLTMTPSLTSVLAVGLSCVLNDRAVLAFDHPSSKNSGGVVDPVEPHNRNDLDRKNDFDSINNKSNDNSENGDMLHRSNQQNTDNLTSSQSPSSSSSDSTNTVDDDAGSGGNGERSDNSKANDFNRNGSSDNGNNRESSSSSYYYNNYYNNGENTRRVHSSVQYDDELTYIDIFGEVAHEVLTQHVIPSTDVECHWDWRTARCEPYCNCAYLFLWGDFHLGRSCRYRTSPPPSQFVNDDDVEQHVNSGSDYEPSWQEAWQEIWNKGKPTVDTPMTSLKSTRETEEEEETITAWDNNTSAASAPCTLPPENLYIRLVKRLTSYTTRSNIVREQIKKLKSASTNTMDAGIVHGRHHLTQIRHRACETVTSKVAERANGRDHPVLLTKQGATWIRKVCGGDAALDDDTVPSRRFVVP